MRHHSLFFSLGGWPPTGGVDPSPELHPVGLPLGADTVHPSSRCLGHLHSTTLLWRIPARVSDDQTLTRNSASPIRRRHNVSAPWNLKGGRERVSNARHLLKLLEFLPQSRQIHTSDF